MLQVSQTVFDTSSYFNTLSDKTKQNHVLLMDADGIITHINPSFTNTFRYSNDDIVGKHFHILFTEEDRKKGMPEQELARVLSNGQSADNTYLVQKDETIVWVSGESILVKDSKEKVSILKIFQNIHEQKITQNFLQHSNEFNENILASIEDIVIVLDEDMKIIKTNKPFEKYFNTNLPFSDLTFENVIKPQENNVLQHKIEHVIKTGNGFFEYEAEIETLQADKRVFDISCRSIRNTNFKEHVLVVLHDITIQKYAERQREDIIGFVAHELRNPLANLVLCIEIMGDTIKEKKTKESLQLLERSQNNVMRLNKMIAELYDATNIGSGNLQLEVKAFHFGDMVKEAIKATELLQPSYNIEVNGSANVIVHGDRHRIIQVVTNYLSNGIKYSDGKINVVLTMQHNENSITVSVKDEGLGIKKDHLPYIFNRFFRAEKTKNLEGMGLGLYLCRQIIKAHQGNVWAESEEGKGSTFYFSIPV